MVLTADFADAQSVASAIRALKARGYGADEIDVFSTAPIQEAQALLERPSRMSLVAITSAVVFCLSAIAFVHYTQHDYRIVTGGMPIFSWWSTGVIFYEFTMFGSLTATFVMFLLESGLLQRGRAIPAPRLEEGRIYLRLICQAGDAVPAAEYLYEAGAAKVDEIEERP
jgi:Protein of unknown function (DUF3341)